MKLTVRRGGGIAGIVRRTELDDRDLHPDDAKDFAIEVARAVPQHPKIPDAEGRHPDATLYEILLDDAGSQVRLNYTEATLPTAAQRLIQWVDARPERRESLER